MLTSTYTRYAAILESYGFQPTNHLSSQPNNWIRQASDFGYVNRVFLNDDGTFRAYSQEKIVAVGKDWELLACFEPEEDIDAGLRAMNAQTDANPNMTIDDVAQVHYQPSIHSTSTAAILTEARETRNYTIH